MRTKEEIAGIRAMLERLQGGFRFDPAMGRGYRIGKQIMVPAMTGMSVDSPPLTLYNNGDMAHEFRWRVTLGARDPEGNTPALQGSGLRFLVNATQENEEIVRTTFLSANSNDAAVLYAPGRSLQVTVTNPNAFALQANFSVDEAAGGYAEWRDQQEVLAASVETALNLPNFCDWFQVVAANGTPLPRVRGYASGGVLVYDEIQPANNLQQIYRIPNVFYTVTPSGGTPGNFIALYHCIG